MNKFYALLLAMATIFGLGACTPASQAQAPTVQQQEVAHAAEPVNPPNVVNAPLAELSIPEVEVTTTPAPVEPEPVYPVEPLPAQETTWEEYAPEYITYEPVTPVYAPTCEEQGLITAEDWSCVAPSFYAPTCEEQGLITAEDYSCVPASFYAPVAPVQPAAEVAQPVAAYTTTGVEWIDSEFTRTGQEIPAGVYFQLTNELNCGAEISVVGTGGCTYFLPDGTHYITVSPELAYTTAGTHVLWHEVGHAVLNTYDECAAEAYAHQFSDPNLWSYPSCQK